MKSTEFKFLMHPKKFEIILKELNNSKDAFTKVNGDTYQKYITIILNDELNKNQKENILNSNNIEESLKLLDIYKINYSCEMT